MRICPKCGSKYSEYPAISRIDNKTEICPVCGVKEALEVYGEYKEQVSKREVDLDGFVVVEHADGKTTLEIDIK